MEIFMRRAANCMQRLRGDDSGMTATGYALIAGAIAVAVVAILLLLGENLDALFMAPAPE